MKALEIVMQTLATTKTVKWHFFSLSIFASTERDGREEIGSCLSWSRAFRTRARKYYSWLTLCKLLPLGRWTAPTCNMTWNSHFAIFSSHGVTCVTKFPFKSYTKYSWNIRCTVSQRIHKLYTGKKIRTVLYYSAYTQPIVFQHWHIGQ